VKSFRHLPEPYGSYSGADLRFLRPSAMTPVFTLRDHGYGASVSRGVPVYVPALKPIPNYTAWWQRHMCVNNLPKVVTRQCPGAESNLRLWVTSGLQVWHVTVRLPSHALQQTHNKSRQHGAWVPVLCAAYDRSYCIDVCPSERHSLTTYQARRISDDGDSHVAGRVG